MNIIETAKALADKRKEAGVAFQDFQPQQRFKWWIRFLLWFKRPSIACDFAYGLKTSLVYKTLFGRIYILKEGTKKA